MNKIRNLAVISLSLLTLIIAINVTTHAQKILPSCTQNQSQYSIMIGC
ncbi:hypothetical protein [Marinicellulosiphila megalodicopiae]